MFTYLDNQWANNWLLNSSTIAGTTTPTAVDVLNAIGPVSLTVAVPTGGSGTLALQPVMALAAAGPFINVPADSILDPTTGLATTFTNIAGAAGTATPVTVFLKRDILMRYVSVTLTPVVAASMSVTIVEGHLRAYTSLAV